MASEGTLNILWFYENQLYDPENSCSKLKLSVELRLLRCQVLSSGCSDLHLFWQNWISQHICWSHLRSWKQVVPLTVSVKVCHTWSTFSALDAAQIIVVTMAFTDFIEQDYDILSCWLIQHLWQQININQDCEDKRRSFGRGLSWTVVHTPISYWKMAKNAQIIPGTRLLPRQLSLKRILSSLSACSCSAVFFISFFDKQ